jgi:hypothetical protein
MSRTETKINQHKPKPTCNSLWTCAYVLRQAGSNRFFRFSFRGDLFLFKDERHQSTALMMSRAAKGLRHVVPCFLHLESFAIPPGFQMFSLGILSVNEFL